MVKRRKYKYSFYSAYPNIVQALILEDGGSVAWDSGVKASDIEKDIAETKQYYKNKKHWYLILNLMHTGIFIIIGE